MTRFVALTDRLLPPIQEPVLELDPRIVFCAAVDRNGYLPTHNRKFSHPQSRDPVWNAANCRNRRIFDDRVGPEGRAQHGAVPAAGLSPRHGRRGERTDEGSVRPDHHRRDGTGAGCGWPIDRASGITPAHPQKKPPRIRVDGGGSGVSNDRGASQGRRYVRQVGAPGTFRSGTGTGGAPGVPIGPQAETNGSAEAGQMQRPSVMAAIARRPRRRTTRVSREARTISAIRVNMAGLLCVLTFCSHISPNCRELF
jgi:hypothetical protein